MQKWQRNYEAIFEIGHLEGGTSIRDNFVIDKKVTISYPITLFLNISLGAIGSAGEGRFQFYNLSPDLRKDLWVDNFNIATKYIFMTLRAGYGPEMPVIFLGKIQNCVSYKDGGSTEWKTEIQAFEGGLTYSYQYINSTYIEGTSWTDILADILSTDQHTKLGYISKDITTIDSDKTLIGQPMDLLKREFEGYQIFINNGLLNILADGEVIPAEMPVLTDSSGLLGSPRRSGMFAEVDMVFEPQLNIGQSVLVKSNLLPEFNQEYKVIQINHNGVISGVVGGELTTSVTLNLLRNEPEVLSKAAPLKYDKKSTDATWVKPVKGRVTSGYGKRAKPTKNASTNHQGIDIGANAGVAVYAPADGKVIMAKLYGGYGKCVQVDHGYINGKHVTSLYGHLSVFNVQLGQAVYKGTTKLGLVGSTGYSTGPHLHFEIHEDGKAINPTKYIGSY